MSEKSLLVEALNKLFWKIPKTEETNQAQAMYILSELADCDIDGIQWSPKKEEFIEFGYICGDDCKGECSGEVDGVPHCPHHLIYTFQDIIGLVNKYQDDIVVARKDVLDELIKEFDPTWIDYNYVSGVIEKFKKRLR